jgi:hypothetical protein
VEVAAGGVRCARCGDPIAPGEPWDLDHRDGSPNEYLGPSHAACNRATATGKVETYEDLGDVFWGPPDVGGGRPRRWSRAWFEWRHLSFEELTNPRRRWGRWAR